MSFPSSRLKILDLPVTIILLIFWKSGGAASDTPGSRGSGLCNKCTHSGPAGGLSKMMDFDEKDLR